MSATTDTKPNRRMHLFPELLLALGLPLLSIFIGSTLAITAYVKGFTEIPTSTAQVARHH